MALSVTGVDANGRIVTSGQVSVSGGILVPKESAGIGDLIYRDTSGNAKVVARGTASGSTITVGSTTYTLYGCIYGFVAGMAMVVAPTETSAKWATSNSPTLPSGTPEYGAGTVLMRNGSKTSYYAQMNTATNASYIYKSGVAQNEPLTSAYQATGLASSAAWNSTGVTNGDILKKYTSWIDYIRQTLRVNGAPGTPFGAVASGVKVHEFGRWMTMKLHDTSTSVFPAANYCATYSVSNTGDAAGNWWLPSMFELGELMIDEHLNKVNANNNTGWTDVSAGSNRWSCVRYSSSGAWYCDIYGLSDHAGFSDYSLTVRPVTLLKLV